MEKYTIKDLQQKYRFKTRQSVYDWLKGASVQVRKEGNRSYVTADDIEKLDELKEHLDKGGSIKSFTPTITPTVYSELDSKDVVPSLTDSVNSEIDITYLRLFEKLVSTLAPSNPISHWEKLDLAAEKGYLLTTQEVKELLGTKPKGREWVRGSFKFIKVGKIGNQSGWKVERLKLSLET